MFPDRWIVSVNDLEGEPRFWRYQIIIWHHNNRTPHPISWVSTYDRVDRNATFTHMIYEFKTQQYWGSRDDRTAAERDGQPKMKIRILNASRVSERSIYYNIGLSAHRRIILHHIYIMQWHRDGSKDTMQWQFPISVISPLLCSGRVEGMTLTRYRKHIVSVAVTGPSHWWIITIKRTEYRISDWTCT